MTCASVHANVFLSSMYDFNTTAQPPYYTPVHQQLHLRPGTGFVIAPHAYDLKGFFSTTGPGINPVSFTRSRFPDGQAAYNTCTFWTPTQEARQQPRRDLSEFS